MKQREFLIVMSAIAFALVAQAEKPRIAAFASDASRGSISKALMVIGRRLKRINQQKEKDK